MTTSFKDLLAKGYTPEQVIDAADAMMGFADNESEDLNVYELEQTKEFGYRSLHSGFYTKPSKGPDKPEYTELAKYMRDELMLICSNHDMHVYDKQKGFYKSVGHIELMSRIAELTKDKLLPSHTENFIKQIKSYCFRREDNFVSSKGKLNFKNGIFDVRTKKMILHNSKHFFKYVLPHNYDDSADCPRWLTFLGDTFKGYEGYIDILSQIFGYCLYGGYPFLHKAFLFYGEGRNGKSTVLDVLRYVLGNDNCSSVPLKMLDKPFSVVNLDGTLANITGEITTKQIDSESFKDAVAGDYLIAAKKRQDEYQLQVHCRFVSACNKLPNFGEQTKGMEEKLYFIPFKNFVPKEKRDPFIFERFKGEASGIMNWALSGLEVLLKNKRLPEIDGTDEVMEEYKLLADSVYAWFKDNISIDTGFETGYSTKLLYQCYQNDMKDLVKSTVNYQSFAKRLGLLIKEKCDGLNLDFENLKLNTRHKKGYKSLRIATSFENSDLIRNPSPIRHGVSYYD